MVQLTRQASWPTEFKISDDIILAYNVFKDDVHVDIITTQLHE